MEKLLEQILENLQNVNQQLKSYTLQARGLKLYTSGTIIKEKNACIMFTADCTADVTDQYDNTITSMAFIGGIEYSIQPKKVANISAGSMIILYSDARQKTDY